MGIPKFFRWMNERYPGLLVTAKENQIPEVDNFYLDMNGIIHNCSHPCDGDVHFRITEDEMFEDIFNYVSNLFKIMRPREYFFMAIDGVAPRAKMNQQRGRRFRSAKEATDRETAEIQKGGVLPDGERFDSNCITPGTDFMVKLSKELKKYVCTKLSSDPDWQKVKVILSGHETPGEGEHKIMDFIRYQRARPGYRPGTRHCLYGLDTDLIMLGLSTHESEFTLLREEVKFNSKKSDATRGKSHRVDPTKISFNVLRISLLRNYIERDFLPLKRKISFKFDLEAIIDDWILLCFLVGNDFIPHIPHFHIHKNALPKILEVYQSTLTKLDGYINEKGILNLKRFRTFAKAMAVVDFNNYKMLLKENGGECAKDDFSKLNMFVRHKLRIHGIRQNEDSRRNHPRSDYPNHTHNQQSDVWLNVRRQTRAGAYNNHTEYHQMHTSARPPTNGSVVHGKSRRPPAPPTGIRSTTNQYGPLKNAPTSQRAPPSKPANGRVGVHSFTEEQINSSITVCADGDFIDLSDEEYLSDEKFPGEIHKSKASMNNNGDGHGAAHIRRSTPKKDRKKLVESRSNELQDFLAYKSTYYREKLKITPDRESILKVVHEYVRALQWNLHYYYHGCVSWGWFYPFHYAPFISDVVNFKKVDTKFDLGEPFKPLDQLLSVLPAASSTLLPKVYRHLVTSDTSPLAKFFPTEVEYDLNGKQNDWEAVVLAPFIDEDALLKASVLCNLFLTQEERAKNSHGPHLLFSYDGPKVTRGQRQLRTSSCGVVKCIEIASNGFHVPMDKIRYGPLNNDQS